MLQGIEQGRSEQRKPKLLHTISFYGDDGIHWVTSPLPDNRESRLAGDTCPQGKRPCRIPGTVSFSMNHHQLHCAQLFSLFHQHTNVNASLIFWAWLMASSQASAQLGEPWTGLNKTLTPEESHQIISEQSSTENLGSKFLKHLSFGTLWT